MWCYRGGSISAEPRINDRIRVPEVRLVGPSGEQVGIVPLAKALELAQEYDLDLVEVAATARPPVCKLMDYGKFKYESAMKAREARKNQAHTVIKEMKLRPKIDPHDYDTKKVMSSGSSSRATRSRSRSCSAVVSSRGRSSASGCSSGWRRTSRTSVHRVEPEAGRPQHDHGSRSAQEEDRGNGRAREAQAARKAERQGRTAQDDEAAEADADGAEQAPCRGMIRNASSVIVNRHI